MIFLLLYECSLSSVDNQSSGDTQILLAVKKIQNFPLLGGRDTKTLATKPI